MNNYKRWLTLVLSGFISYASYSVSHASESTIDQPTIHVNQVGFLVEAPKLAVVPNVPATHFTLIDTSTGLGVYTGNLSDAKEWVYAKEQVKLARFSDFKMAGTYQVQVDGIAHSVPFSINNALFQDALVKSIRAYYYNRSGTPLQKEYAGEYDRPGAHPDTIVFIHASAASVARPEGSIIASPKGWYDAGDYNKYIVNSNITLYTLLSALKDYPEHLESLNLNLPESTNRLPDFVDEILWNLDWMLTMQDPNDGGVYHKLTTKRFTSEGPMPHLMNQKRYVVSKSSAAALGFTAVMAQASRVLSPYENVLPKGYLDRLRLAAKRAWLWSSKHPDIYYQQPQDIKTGEYSQKNKTLTDERLWATAEMFVMTGDERYLSKVKLPQTIRTPEWYHVETLALLTLANFSKTPKKLKQAVLQRLIDTANGWVETARSSAYGLAIEDNDFIWGSNSKILNRAFTLLRLNRLDENPAYVSAANGLLDYVLGRNPLGMSYVTGVGKNTPMHIHHRVSRADSIKQPIPGFLAGGPQPNQQDAKTCQEQGMVYPSPLPALSYIDHVCSYASNEVAINWNAPLVYVLAAFQK